ncbi:MAG: hypothetical protein HC853_12075 [Anaerolineae bacterium]|nr:hypothetical protein [Anaerolineae bacterium]
MASIPNPLPLPNPSQPQKPKKKQIDIPYNRWPNRLRRALISFIKITLLLSFITATVMFASNGDVELQLVLGTLTTLVTILFTFGMVILQLVLTYGLLLWFWVAPSSRLFGQAMTKP